MTLLHIAGLAILAGCSAALLVWFGWGFIANVLALRSGAIETSTTESKE